MPSCIVPRCGSRCGVNKTQAQKELENRTHKISFHHLPRDSARREMWLRNLQILDFKGNISSSCVCSLHFSESSFDRTSLSTVRLRDFAVPFIDVNCVRLSDKLRSIQESATNIKNTTNNAIAEIPRTTNDGSQNMLCSTSASNVQMPEEVASVTVDDNKANSPSQINMECTSEIPRTINDGSQNMSCSTSASNVQMPKEVASVTVDDNKANSPSQINTECTSDVPPTIGEDSSDKDMSHSRSVLERSSKEIFLKTIHNLIKECKHKDRVIQMLKQKLRRSEKRFENLKSIFADLK